MAYEVAWSPVAIEDVEEIAKYIARDSEVYAARMVQRFFDAADYFADFPNIGRSVPEGDDPAYRDWIVGSYRLIYRVEAERVVIIAVVHGGRLLRSSIGERLPRQRRRKDS